MKNKYEDYNDGYYHIGKDFEDYPGNWCYITYSRRGPGKTYSLLWYCYYNKIPLIYMKRTIEDVNLICSSNDYGFDPSPYVPINRDKGTNIKALKIKDGIGAFYEYDDDGPVGLPVAYILALSAVKRYKGFDFSQCGVICLDEFIPQIGERYNHQEGSMLLDVYMTVARDREKRGKEPLKLVLFANAEEISSPICNELEVVDDIANLNASGCSHYYNYERGIIIHHITEDEFPITEHEKSGIYKGMLNTAWHAKSFGGEFANNDFSNIVRINLKKFKCLYKLHYKTHDYYIYNHPNGMFYMCETKNKPILEYDLNLENDQKLFYADQWIDLREACINGQFKFAKYSMYDLIINYRKFFKL